MSLSICALQASLNPSPWSLFKQGGEEMCCVIQQRGNPVIQFKIRKDLVLFGVGSAHIVHIRTAGPAVQRPDLLPPVNEMSRGQCPPGPWSVWTTDTVLSDPDRSRLDGCMEKFDDGQQQFFTPPPPAKKKTLWVSNKCL